MHLRSSCTWPPERSTGAVGSEVGDAIGLTDATPPPPRTTQAADPDKRTVALAYRADLEADLGAKASLRQLRHEFVTQEQAYDVGDGGEAAAAASEGAAAPTDDAAAAVAAADLGQAEEAAEQQLKKQRIS